MPKIAGFRYVLLIALACLVSIRAFAAEPSFASFSASGCVSSLHADLNNDGHEDFVTCNYLGYFSSGSSGFTVQLANGTAPVNYLLPHGDFTGAIGIGDFNGDGNADLIVAGYLNSGPETLYLYLNNGKGAFTEAASFPVGPTADLDDLVVGDFNHDGIMDVAFLRNSAVTVWFGDGKSGFKAGPSTLMQVGAFGYLMLGDFDGDGHADLLVGDGHEQGGLVLYGDGTGYFPVQTPIPSSGAYSYLSATDVNGDGTTDIVASINDPNTTNYLQIFYGDSNRTMQNTTTIPISHCATFSGVTTAADVNGDGINDLIVQEGDCGTYSSGYKYVGILTRNSNATYNPDQIVYQTPARGLNLIGPYIVSENADAKPDIVLTQCTGAVCNQSKVLLNTTSGAFHTCAAPNAFEGINVCSPGPGSTVTSPVSFRVGAAGQVNMRKVEVWVDGKKLVEQLNGFSKYTFLDQSLDLMSGMHHVDIYAAGGDNSLQEKSFELNVH